MYREGCLGKPSVVEKIKCLSDALNAEVVDQVNGSQELVMLNKFASECNEYRFKKSIQERISEVSSWRWVLEDLTKRLEESVEALQYERNALCVVVQRIKDEVRHSSREASRCGALTPTTDIVEEAIMKEYNFLRDQKKKFEQLVLDLDKQIAVINKSKNRIAKDLLNKEQAITIDKMCADKDYKDSIIEDWKKKKKRGLPSTRWLNRCAALKRAGIKSLCSAVITRQQVRGARMRLSICAQTYATRIDAALRRRLHYNHIKLQDLNWRKDEALKDCKVLGEELQSSEQSLVRTMDLERIAAARIADRFNRPGRERTKDDVDLKLREELNQLRLYSKELRNNIKRIVSLQNNLNEVVAHISCCEDDIVQVISLDEARVRARQGNDDTSSGATSHEGSNRVTKSRRQPDQLTVIQEELEDDYPFDN